jgi:hypothetical protein
MIWFIAYGKNLCRNKLEVKIIARQVGLSKIPILFFQCSAKEKEING